MNSLSPLERELVAIGASLASNCIPCVTYHIAMARKVGLTETQITAAIELADKVRQMPARAVLDASQNASLTLVPDQACGCSAVTGSSES